MVNGKAPGETTLIIWQQGGNRLFYDLTVRQSTRRIDAVRDELAEAFHIPEKNVRVIVPDTGSGYGGKHTGECAVEAARLAKAAGKPVKLQWTREEEFTWAYFRPAGVIDVRAGVRSDGTLLAWEFQNYNSGPAAINIYYNVANQRIQFHPTSAPPLRQGSYRGLAATANHFARESAMDEIAHAIGLDPLEFRLKNMTDPRLRAVVICLWLGDQTGTVTRVWYRRRIRKGRIRRGLRRGGGGPGKSHRADRTCGRGLGLWSGDKSEWPEEPDRGGHCSGDRWSTV